MYPFHGFQTFFHKTGVLYDTKAYLMVRFQVLCFRKCEKSLHYHYSQHHRPGLVVLVMGQIDQFEYFFRLSRVPENVNMIAIVLSHDKNKSRLAHMPLKSIILLKKYVYIFLYLVSWIKFILLRLNSGILEKTGGDNLTMNYSVFSLFSYNEDSCLSREYRFFWKFDSASLWNNQSNASIQRPYFSAHGGQSNYFDLPSSWSSFMWCSWMT